MLKITKGLKKKKKGKKSKHKEDELFDSAELEEYRRQQQEKQKEGGEGEQEGEATVHEESEEWLKFKALTSGVDDILKKTQGDLDRIKSTSFFQKKPPGPSEPPKEAKPVRPALPPPAKSKWVGFEEGSEKDNEQEHTEEKAREPPQPEHVEEHVEEEEEESEFEDDQDDIFDTSYVDVVAKGEVKLAYVPDSPIEELSGPDPFDTSIVDKVIKLDPKEQKRSLISLGCAVEVLTGKLDKSPCRELPSSTPRKRPKAQDLLLGSFDEGDGKFVIEGEAEPPPKSILDDDPIFEEETSAVLGLPPVTPLTEVKPICTPVKEGKPQEKNLVLKELVQEFVPETSDTVAANTDEDDLDDEFAALAVESLSKKPPPPPRPQTLTANQEEEEDDVFLEGDDPFDTTFASQVLPGKFELKLIEKEILEKDIPVRINSVEEKINVVLKSSELSIRLSKSADQNVCDAELEPLSLKHRDLLGGSTTDLTKIDQLPIAPKSISDEREFGLVADPFDTSIAEVFAVPGKTELKFLEKELLEENKPTVQIEVDDDFDPRAEEKRTKPPRPDNLSVGARQSIPKVVAFDVEFPKEETDLLAVGQEENSKVGKPLTPYYPSKTIEDSKSFEDEADPFDTSFVSNCPGKVELQIIEKELAFEEKKTLKHSISDPDFDPRGAEIKPENKRVERPDILTSEIIVDAKLHTPVAPKKFIEQPTTSEVIDPFDTSIANTLVPGKAEIKILETELIHKESPPIPAPNTTILEKLRRDSESFSSLRKNSITDVLELPHEDTSVKPLTPLAASSSFEQDDIDPFDTSCVGDILPGKTEIKLLESELMLN